MGIGKRIQQLIEYLDMSNNAFGKSVGTSSTRISYITSERNQPNLNLLTKILKAYNFVSTDWLIKGEGPMLKNVHGKVHPNVHPNDQSQNETYISKEEVSEVNEEEEEFSRRISLPRVVTVNESGAQKIAMIDANAAAGLPANIENPQFYEDLPVFGLPWREYQLGQHIAIQVTGDSMHPTIYHHDWLISQYLDDPQEIREGYIYIVVTTTGVVAKRVLNRIEQRHSLSLKSDNPEYPTYDENIDNILALYRVKCRLTFNLINLNENTNQRLNIIETKVNELEQKLKGNK